MKFLYRCLLPFIAIIIYVFIRKKKYKTRPGFTSLLWEVNGKELQQPSYLLGTMHLMCEEDAVLSKNALSIIKSVKQVYLEMDITDELEMMKLMNELPPPEKKLSEVLSADEYERVKKFFEEHTPSTPFFILEQQHPMMILSGLYELFLNCENKSSLEAKIIEQAKKHNKRVKGLETFAVQYAILQSIPYEQQAKELLNAIDNLDEYNKEVNEMVMYYRMQDIEQLYKLSTKEHGLVTANIDSLLYDRNEDWSRRFSQIAANGSVLLAVGAGHLGGDKGLISLLKQQGYKLRPLVNK